MTDEELYQAITFEDKIITINDIRLVFKGCVNGWRQFAKAHNIDIRDVSKNGIKASTLIAIDDEMVRQLLRSIYGR